MSWRIILLTCIAILLALALAQPVFAQDSEAYPSGLSCKAFLLYDLEHSREFASHNADDERQIASLTKLMTSLLVCERLRFDGRYQLNAAETRAYHTDTLRAQQILELMLVASNNRTCEVAARLVSGNTSNFVELMNRRARELGLNHTKFANPSGLPASGQHSTAHDVLTLMLTVREHDQARWAMGQHSLNVGGHAYTSTLAEMYQRHPGLIGGKTGYTRAAGRCLALEYECDGKAYLVITLGSKDIATGFADAEKLLTYYGLYNGVHHTW